MAGGGQRVPRGVDQHRPSLGLAALTTLRHGAACLRSFISIGYYPLQTYIVNMDIPFFIEELAKFGINGILLKKVSVGAIPPRVTGVKVSTSQSGEVSPAILIYFDLKSIMSYNTLRRPKLPHSHALIF